MTQNKYTLDRIEDGFFVFLKKPDEMEELLIPASDISITLTEGDIVNIEKHETKYHFELLEKETNEMKSKVQELLEKLKRK